MLFTESYLLKPSQLTGKMNLGEGSEVNPQANFAPKPFSSTIIFDTGNAAGNKLLAQWIYLGISKLDWLFYLFITD